MYTTYIALLVRGLAQHNLLKSWYTQLAEAHGLGWYVFYSRDSAQGSATGCSTLDEVYSYLKPLNIGRT